jgi:Kef-type K+ transport system membrane component KefB
MVNVVGGGCCMAWHGMAQIGGALVGPHALNIIRDVHQVQHLAELGVVFLLFNIGLELSLERLQSMAKYVFGMGAAQVSWAGGGKRGNK